MSIWLNRHADGSISFFIGNALQFDSHDERIYHECLALPAIALAESTFSESLSVLICGGGDGLVLREVLKSRAVAAVDLVDCDQSVIDCARDPLSLINGNSLADSRVTVHIADAWEYVKAQERRFHIVICDLTVPLDFAATRMHSIEWYAMLNSILKPGGLLAVNMTSPSAKPGAYWSMVNTMRSAQLKVRPYRVALPSFTRQGYGPDWGFALASDRSIDHQQMQALHLPGPRHALTDNDVLCRLFRFPSCCAEHRLTAGPIARASNDLIERLERIELPHDCTHPEWDALAWNADREPGVSPSMSNLLIPHTLSRVLVEETSAGVILGPSLANILAADFGEQVRELIDRLLMAPVALLQSIDLCELLARLLERAAELPQVLVSELQNLRKLLAESALGQLDASDLNARALAVISLIVIMANLASPDAAFGKGCGGGHGGGGHGLCGISAGFGGFGFGGGSCGHGGFGFSGISGGSHGGSFGCIGGHFGIHGGASGFHHGGFIAGDNLEQLGCSSHGLEQTGLTNFQSHGPLSMFAGIRSQLSGSRATYCDFRQFVPGGRICTNCFGAVMPARKLNCWSSLLYLDLASLMPGYDDRDDSCTGEPLPQFANYQLGSDVYVMPDTSIAVMLDHKTAMLIMRDLGTVIDTNNGRPIMQVAIDEPDRHNLRDEIESQRLLIEKDKEKEESWLNWKDSLALSADQSEDSQQLIKLSTIASLLTGARDSLGKVGGSAPEQIDDKKPSLKQSDAVQPDAKPLKAKQADAIQIDPKPLSAKPADLKPLQADRLPSKRFALFKLLPGVFVDPSGSNVIIQLPNGKNAYMTGRAWFKDEAHLEPCGMPYPSRFRDFLTNYLKDDLKRNNELCEQRQQQLFEMRAHLANLFKEQDGYQLHSSTSLAKTQAPLPEGLEAKPMEAAPAQDQARTVERDANSNVISDSSHTVPGTQTPDMVQYGLQQIAIERAKHLTDQEIASTRKTIDGLSDFLSSRELHHGAIVKLLGLLQNKE